MKNIAILLTVFNRKEQTLLCLQNIFTQSLPKDYKLDVYLVNDGCTDGTPEAIEIKYPMVILINAKGNLFWNRGMHLAWKTAIKQKTYDFFIWLNDDTILDKKAIESLIITSQLKEHQSIIIGSTSATNNNQQVTYGGRSFSKGLLPPQKTAVECDYFNGNIVLIPNTVYKKVGTNDPVFHHALGDFDYGLRAAKLGVQSFVAPGFLGQCDVHTSLGTWCNPEKTFKQRWQAFRSPLGNNPEEFFVFEKRHKGLLKAIFHYFTNHLRVCLPSLWSKTK